MQPLIAYTRAYTEVNDIQYSFNGSSDKILAHSENYWMGQIDTLQRYPVFSEGTAPALTYTFLEMYALRIEGTLG